MIGDYHRSQPTRAAINVFGGRKKFGGLDFNVYIKGILSTSCVIFSYPKLLSISVLTSIK
jgi:hypothetical protein